ncbi:hypothetical protein [Chelatococcus albus]|uniref:LPD3 domain-containing protein n=1 Tax=Chelatococcus albus TaxID=3047466 RepID=UPI003BEEB2F3
MPALRAAAQRWYDENLVGSAATMRDGSVVQFNRRGLRKSTFGGKGDVLLRAVPAIRAIIETGQVVHREPGNRPGIIERAIVSAPVSLAGETHRLAVSIHRRTDGNWHYDFTFDRSAGGPGVGVPGETTGARSIRGVETERSLGRSAAESTPAASRSRASTPGGLRPPRTARYPACHCHTPTRRQA